MNDFEEMTKAADAILAAADLDLATQVVIDNYNAHRNEGAEPMPEIQLLGWQDYGAGILINDTYIRQGGEWIFRRFYYSANWDKIGEAVIAEDHQGNEVAQYPLEPAAAIPK